MILHQYTISDLYSWIKERTLILNPEFQRRNNWPQDAKAYLIDTILRELPIPNIYMRTMTDTKTMRAYREVVDGQQRLRTITEFIDGVLRLGIQTKEYEGKRYDDLEEDEKSRFLAYSIGVVQLFDATDDVVLDIFNRLNAYGLSLYPQELRHGKYQGGRYIGFFRRTVIDAASRWSILWDRFRVVSVAARIRMADDEFMAQMFGVILEGVKDGGQPSIDRLYERYDAELPLNAVERVDEAVEFMISHIPEVLETRLSGAPHFLMLFAAVSHALFGIPIGKMGDPHPALPVRDELALTNLAVARDNLRRLGDVLEEPTEEIPERFYEFKLASAGTTQRIKGRSIRFVYLYKALLPEPI